MPNPRFHPFVRLLLCAFAVIVCATIAVAVTITVLISSGLVSMPSSGPTMAALTASPRLSAALLFAQAPAILIAVVLCRILLDARSFSSLGLRARNVPQFFSGAFCGLLAIAFVFALLWIGGHVQVTGLSQRATEIGPGGIVLRLAFWAIVMLGVGVAEETLFRGYLLHNLSAWLGADKTALGAAAIIQSLLFGLVHMGNLPAENANSALQALPNLVLIGIFFALCAFKTGSLWFPIGFHAAWNFLLGSVFSLPVSGLATFRLFQTEVSGSRWLTGGAFGAEGSLLLTILIIVMIYVIRQSPDHAQFIGDIATLRPEDEPDEIEVASRAPGLRERKEQRRTQTATTSTFEGWNDLAPPQHQRYSTYQPQQTPPQQASNTFPESPFAENAPLPNAPLAAPPVTPSPTDFADYRPPTGAPAPAPVAPPLDFNELVPPMPETKIETKPQTPAPPIDEAPATTEPEAPPVASPPPVKKPPAPRW